MIKLVIFVLFISCSYAVVISNVTMICIAPLECLPLRSCNSPEDSGEVLFPCGTPHQAQNTVCCQKNEPQETILTDLIQSIFTNNTADVTNASFPENCGISLGNRISNGENATIGEHPWMALLGYSTPAIDIVQFLCGGTLINKRWILTAAHCIELEGLTLSTVRLGELDMSTGIDCTADNSSCADPALDVSVQQFFMHPEYDTALKNDIALVKLAFDIEFTDYIRPICLPFNFKFTPQSFTNKNFKIAGWGRTNFESYMGSTLLQFADVVGLDTASCNKKVPQRLKPIQRTQICASGQTGQDSCKGDSGGPLTNVTTDGLSPRRAYQIGIVSAGIGPCGNTEIPSVYTRVDQFINWIKDTVECNT